MKLKLRLTTYQLYKQSIWVVVSQKHCKCILPSVTGKHSASAGQVLICAWPL